MLAGLLLANPSECTTTADSFCTTTDFTDCNCGIDNAASFEGVSDCPDLHARMGRVCEQLRACADPDYGDPDSGPGLAIGLALGGCLLVAVLAAAIFFWLRTRRTKPPSSSASTTAPRQVEVIVTQPVSTQPETQQPTAAPESLAAVLAACGLQHHEKTFQAEGYTLETLLKSIKQGDAAARSDLRELKLNMGECRKLINHLKAGMRQGQESI